MSDSRTLQPGQSVGGGRFTLTRMLGRGGMGVVWLGQDTRLGEEVALKFLPPEVAADAVALNDLRRETARSHKLTHPNIIRIHDFHEQADAAFISMEFVNGPTLSAWRLQQANQVLTWEQLAPLVQQLCAALDYAHGESVIHRDLKPANVMLDAKGRLKLADFGIAAVVSDSASRVSMLGTSGTLAYMSPQQLTGKRPTATDDIYALGASLYELLTGKPPFYTGDLTHQVLHEPPEPVEERLAALGIQNPIPSDVAALIMACLAKDPAQRPQSAAAVAQWLGSGVISGGAFQNVDAGAMEQSADAIPTAEFEAVTLGKKHFPGRAIAIGAAVVLTVAVVAWWAKARTGKHGSSTAHESNNSVSVSSVGDTGFDSTGAEEIKLFDGNSTAAWKGGKTESFPTGAWAVEDGVLKTRALAANNSAKQDLVTRESFSDFELDFDWRVERGGNSGVFYGQREFQLVDDVGHPNGKVPETSCGSLFGFLAPGSNKPSVTAGQFHHGKLVVNGSQVEHWINGQRILEYDLASDSFKALIAGSKIPAARSAAEITRVGKMPIALQDHTGVASFKNIRLMRLTKGTVVSDAPASQPRPATTEASLVPGQANLLRAVIVDGQNNPHNWKATTPLLKNALEVTGLFTVEVATAPGEKDPALADFKPDFARYRVIVMNYNGALWGEATRKALEDYMSGGGGLVVFHAADNSFAQWPAYNEMIGVGGWGGRDVKSGTYLRWRDGRQVLDNKPGPAGHHGPQREFVVETRDPKHPIMAGLPTQWLHTKDELYDCLRGPAKNATILATAFADSKQGGSGEHEPQLLAIRYGAGRVFHTTLGHGPEAMKCVGLITTLQRGTEWAATGNVTQKVPTDFPKPNALSLR